MAGSKLLSAVAEDLGFQIEANRAYGVCNQILFNIITVFDSTQIIAHTGSINPVQKEEIRKFLKDNKRSYSIKNPIDIRDNFVSLRLEKAFAVIKADGITLFVRDFSRFLYELGFSCGCSVCQTKGEFPFSSTEAGILMVCEPCHEQYQKSVEDIKEERSYSGSYLSGFLGAFLGAAVGIIPWVLIGMAGYVAAISGFVMAWLSFLGYKLFKGKFGKGTVAIVISVLFVMTLAAVLTTETVYAYQDGSLMEYFGSDILFMFEAFIMIPELFTLLLKEFGIGLLFTGLGAFTYLRKVYRTTTSKDIEMKRL